MRGVGRVAAACAVRMAGVAVFGGLLAGGAEAGSVGHPRRREPFTAEAAAPTDSATVGEDLGRRAGGRCRRGHAAPPLPAMVQAGLPQYPRQIWLGIVALSGSPQ